MTHPAHIDSRALRLARVISEIYAQDCPGGDAQKLAKVQVLLADVLGHERAQRDNLSICLGDVRKSRDHWQQRYREITGEAE